MATSGFERFPGRFRGENLAPAYDEAEEGGDMTDLVVMEGATALADGYRAPTCEAAGTTRSSLFRPDGFSLWEIEAELDAGAELRWGTDHGDEVVYVLEGTLSVEGS